MFFSSGLYTRDSRCQFETLGRSWFRDCHISRCFCDNAVWIFITTNHFELEQGPAQPFQSRLGRLRKTPSTWRPTTMPLGLSPYSNRPIRCSVDEFTSATPAIAMPIPRPAIRCRALGRTAVQQSSQATRNRVSTRHSHHRYGTSGLSLARMSRTV